MYCILSKSSDPYFNLATEEYLLRNFSEDIFMLYVNESSIIVGKHQNAISEINLDFIDSENLKVARRLSGGGTVYHDEGNLNFCFISTVEGNNKVNFKKYTQPILEVLLDLGLDASSGGRNDLKIKGYKVSGNAEHIFKNRVLHHGTLLFDSDLNALRNSLKVNLNRFNDKSVQSVRSKVANINELLDNGLQFNKFKELIVEKALKIEGAELFELSNEDFDSINKLHESKFSTWEWNFGYSPKYEYSNTLKMGVNTLLILLAVEKGLIKNAEIKYSGNDYIAFEDICMRMIGKKHFPIDMSWLKSTKISLPETVISGKDIYSLLF